MKKVIETISAIWTFFIILGLMFGSVFLIFWKPLAFLLLLTVTIVLYILDPFDQQEIEIKYFDSDMLKIRKIHNGDWIDLRVAETVELKAGEYRLLRLGVGMILPNGYEAHVVPRSSTPSKFGIMCANSIGIIDNSYCGDKDEWKFPAVAIRDTKIEKGDRIAQFRIVKNQPRIRFKTVFHLKEISRGGIGSTGRK